MVAGPTWHEEKGRDAGGVVGNAFIAHDAYIVRVSKARSLRGHALGLCACVASNDHGGVLLRQQTWPDCEGRLWTQTAKVD